MERLKAGNMKRQIRTMLFAVLSLGVIVSLVGCSAAPPKSYTFSQKWMRYNVEREIAPRFDAKKPQIERGGDFWLTDKVGHYLFSLPGKILLWNTRVGNHKFSEEKQQLVHDYLAGNDLDRVKVRVNQYAPIGEFKRLWHNSDVNPFYRVTFGFASWVGYTVLPGRLFAGFPLLGDGYNPYTNTVYIYSDLDSLAIKSAARSRDLAERKWKGTYATLGIIPGVDLYQGHLATRDTIKYFYTVRDKESETGSYKILYPAWAGQLAPGAIAVGPVPAIVHGAIAIPGAIVGHITGRGKARNRNANDDPPWGAEVVAID